METIKIFLTVNEVSSPLKISTIIYFSFLLGYNIVGTYQDSKKYLENYRQGKLKTKSDLIKSDLDAVVYGANINRGERLWNSIIWPITVIKNIIPSIVLALNPPKDNKKNQ